MSSIKPGINPNVILTNYTPEEKAIIKNLGKEWYITNGGSKISTSNVSHYKYLLMKPTLHYKDLFNIEREVMVIFSDYESFEPRTVDVFEKVLEQRRDLRVEKVCSILISRDPKIEIKIENLLKGEHEHGAVVPFTYDELTVKFDEFYIRNRFKDFFYSRDLFAFNSALKKDIYFFGRNDLIHDILNRHKSNENSGLFGLRKTGKTSIVYGLQRAISNSDGISIFLDCQLPSFHLKRWNKALKHVIDEIKTQTEVAIVLKNEADYTEQSAASMFEKDLVKLSRKLGNKNILLIFDEIEHLSPGTSISSHWNSSNDFVLFWQTLRSLFQKHNNLFSYLLVGTNPKCVETAFINNVDNPIFNQIPFQYIVPFDVPQTKDMVERIGSIMGLKFDEIVYSKLTDDFGGHPFLMRNVCSIINSLASSIRPVRVDKMLYEKGKQTFYEMGSSYIEMILSVLKEHYNDEYEMLRYLAIGNYEQFNEFANISKEYTNHLIGYNILDKNSSGYFFKIESIRDYLLERNKYKKLKMTLKEKHSEISERRNVLEGQLRTIARTVLVSNYGQNEAKIKVLDLMGDPRKSKYYSYTLKEIFSPNKSEIYLEDLKKIILKEWQAFEQVFGKDRESFTSYITAINKSRADAHAKEISDEDMEFFRICATKLEAFIESYL